MKYEIKETTEGKVLVDKYTDLEDNTWYYFEGKVLQFIGRKILGDKIIAYPIIATINHSISLDLPMVVIENRIEKLAENYAKEAISIDLSYSNGLFYGYIAGCKMMQEDGVYSEKDIRNAIQFGEKLERYPLTYNIGNTPRDNFIQSLKQKYIELEREQINNQSGSSYSTVTEYKIKTDRNKDGQLMAYEKK